MGSLRSELARLRKAMASLPAKGDAAIGKPFARFWHWCAGLLKKDDLTPDERQDWAAHQARCREQVMADPSIALVNEQLARLGRPPLTEPPDDPIALAIELRRQPTPTPDPTKE